MEKFKENVEQKIKDKELIRDNLVNNIQSLEAQMNQAQMRLNQLRTQLVHNEGELKSLNEILNQIKE